ncbi:MAG: DUF1801 domain-containing protein [Melioribacteraceae bacterium]|nr:DUF1801 domain-containing protein [Melioribacteraceae bacterium]
MIKIKPRNIDEFISNYPQDIQLLLEKMRSTIKEAAPGVQEKISYGIPTFILNGNLVHFAPYKNHIGFYPSPSGIQAFQKELTRYKSSKGAIQFPIDEPLPLKLISRIVKFRVKENLGKTKRKGNL